VGREIVIERAPEVPSSPPAADGTVPVMLKERSTGNHIRVGPGNRIEVIAPKPIATPQPIIPPQPIALLDPSQVSPQANPKGETMRYPLASAVPITSPFGMRTHPISGTSEFHQGTDLGAGMGAPILAAYTGQVVQSGPNGGLGNSVTLAHGPYVRTRYGHMSQVAVQVGQIVKQGTIIGSVGSTGMSTGPHLHFELWQAAGGQWSPIDPYQQLQVAVAQLPR
jgi:murein DD-endopeptidase MepM/ murein hydrolase activator NlpD